MVEPLRPDRFSARFTASAVLREKLERLQALMPDADLAGIIEAAVTEKLERLEARRFAKTKTPSPLLGPIRSAARPRGRRESLEARE